MNDVYRYTPYVKKIFLWFYGNSRKSPAYKSEKISFRILTNIWSSPK